MQPRAIVRCDASPAIGGGHLVRGLTLAAALRGDGWHVRLAVDAETTALFGGCLDPLHTLTLTDGPVTTEAARMAAALGDCDLLIVDHYRRDATFEHACRTFAARIVAIDDLADRPHDADLLIDSGGSRQRQDYARLVPTGCRLAIGPAYAPLRSAFVRQRRRSLARRQAPRPLRRVLIAFGATDPLNLTAQALLAIDRTGLKVDVDVVLGAAAARLPEVARQVALRPRTRLWTGTDRVAALMSRADVAFGAAGLSGWERCCLGLPSIVVGAAANQDVNLGALIAAGAAIGSDGTVDSLADGLLSLAETRTRRVMAGAAARLCDGRGAQRSLMEIRPEQAGRGATEVRLTPVTAADCGLIHAWQCQPPTRRYALNPLPPTAEEHAAWFDRILADPGCLFSLIVADGQPVGFLRLEWRRQGLRQGSFEVSIAVDADRCGEGLGTAALRLARRLAPEATLTARIKPDNTASLAAFRRAGYRPTTEGWFMSGLPRPADLTAQPRRPGHSHGQRHNESGAP